MATSCQKLVLNKEDSHLGMNVCEVPKHVNLRVAAYRNPGVCESIKNFLFRRLE